MTGEALKAVIYQLSQAGLNISLASSGRLAVAPASHLTENLRELIRSSKALLIDWLTLTNDADCTAHDPPDNPLDWKELAVAYNAHHLNCPTCIAAGRGSRYGQRCGVGKSLWRTYTQD